MSYDAMDTARWMLDGLRWSLGQETATGPNGKPKKKTKTQQSEERLRFETLCELLWNVEGRPEEFTSYSTRLLAS